MRRWEKNRVLLSTALFAIYLFDSMHFLLIIWELTQISNLPYPAMSQAIFSPPNRSVRRRGIRRHSMAVPRAACGAAYLGGNCASSCPVPRYVQALGDWIGIWSWYLSLNSLSIQGQSPQKKTERSSIWSTGSQFAMPLTRWRTRQKADSIRSFHRVLALDHRQWVVLYCLQSGKSYLRSNKIGQHKSKHTADMSRRTFPSSPNEPKKRSVSRATLQNRWFQQFRGEAKHSILTSNLSRSHWNPMFGNAIW